MKHITLERVTAKQAQDLYELGFPAKETSISGLEKIACTYIAPPKGYMGAWDNSTGMINPMLEEVTKWLRDEKNIQISIRWSGDTWCGSATSGKVYLCIAPNFKTHEEATSACIDYAINYLKSKTDIDTLKVLLHEKYEEKTELTKKVEALMDEIDAIEKRIENPEE